MSFCFSAQLSAPIAQMCCSLISLFVDLEMLINVMQVVNLSFPQSFRFFLYTWSHNHESLLLKIRPEWRKTNPWSQNEKLSAFSMYLYLLVFLQCHYIIPWFQKNYGVQEMEKSFPMEHLGGLLRLQLSIPTYGIWINTQSIFLIPFIFEIHKNLEEF